jgi:inosose dehydratase
MGPLDVVKQYRARVNHVHAKDMDGQGRWALIGTGVVPVAEVAQFLQQTGYQGWFVLEDESELARRDPDGVAVQLGRYVDEVLRPLVSGAGQHASERGPAAYQQGDPNG